MEIRSLFGYQVGVEGVEEVPSDGALGGASGAGVETGAGAGGGAGFGFTTRFLAAFRAFFFIAFLAFFFFFAKTRFTETMFRLCKPNNAFPSASLICRWFCCIHVSTTQRVDRAAEWSNWLPKKASCYTISWHLVWNPGEERRGFSFMSGMGPPRRPPYVLH